MRTERNYVQLNEIIVVNLEMIFYIKIENIDEYW